MLNVFISYGHEDLEPAMRLYQTLKDIEGIDPWIDKESLQPGITWRPAIRKAIRESDVFVAILSKRATSRKGFIHSELRTALKILSEFPESEIFLIPIRLDNCNMPIAALSEIQYIDFFPAWDKGMDRVLRVLDSKLAKNRADAELETIVSNRRYVYRVGIADLDVGLTNLMQIAQRLNSIQNYFHFTCPTLPSVRRAVRTLDGIPNLAVYEIPNRFFTEHQYLNVDLVTCLTRYPLAFEEDKHIVYNYFSGSGEVDERFRFISTHQLYGFTKKAGCSFEKGIAYIITSQLITYFTDWGYHSSTQGCVMDFCENREDMVKGLEEMRFCYICDSMIENPELKDTLEILLQDEMSI